MYTSLKTFDPKKINPRKGKDFIYFLTLNEGNRKANHFDVMFNLK